MGPKSPNLPSPDGQTDPAPALAESVPQLVWVARRDGYATYVNRRWTEYTGRPSSELVGWGWQQVLHPDDLSGALERWTAALAAAAPCEAEYRLRRADGAYRWHLARALPEPDAHGQILRWVGTVTDIDDHRRSEENQAWRAAVVESSEDAIVSTDAAPAITSWNPAAERLFGYAAAEVLGRSPFVLVPPDRQGEFQELVGRVQRGERVPAFETVRLHKEGRPVAVSLSLSPVLGAGGAVAGFAAIYRDSTGHRRLEDQLRQAQKMEAVGRLAGGIAHDFNNLLTVINGYAELLLETVPRGDPLRDMLTDMKTAGDRAAAVTRQLLAYSRRQILAPVVLDLNAVVTDMGRMLRRVIGEDIELVTELAPGLRRVQADPGQLEQVVLNLAVNARDAMPQGGRLTLATADADPQGPAARRRPGQYVQLIVRDTGCGMTDEVKARIFEPFFTTKGVGQGTGLGLATVYGIVEQSGGCIEVESAPGRGTTFTIELPAADAAPGEPGSTEAVRAGAYRGNETVLLVEDEDAVRTLAGKVLWQNGYTVLEARDGQEALFLSEQVRGRIHLLLTDVVMPGLGGHEVARRLCDRHPRLRVLYMSGYTDDAVVRHGLGQVPANFLAKPFTPTALAAKVRAVLDAPRTGSHGTG